MSELKEIKFWYAYNSHVRKKYLRSILSLPKADLLKDRGASYPSILDIFVHVLDGYRYWFFTINEGGAEESEWRGKTPVEVLKELEREVDQKVMSYLNSLSSDLELDRTIMNGAFDLRDLLNHMIEEELQHRGELNALFWQIDIDPPISGVEDAKYIKMHVSGEKCPICDA